MTAENSSRAMATSGKRTRGCSSVSQTSDPERPATTSVVVEALRRNPGVAIAVLEYLIDDAEGEDLIEVLGTLDVDMPKLAARLRATVLDVVMEREAGER